MTIKFSHPCGWLKGLCSSLLSASFVLTSIILLTCQQASAQQFQLQGTVIDHGKQPLPAAHISLPELNLHTVTDSLGRFSIAVPKAVGYLISISHAGFKATERNVGVHAAVKPIQIMLHPFNQQLREVNVQDRHAEERRQTESLNVQVVGQDFIQRNLGGSLMATLSRMPGIKTIGIGSGQSKPLIRGLGFNRVVVTDKGIKHEGQQWGADHGLELDQFAAGEVELIKGAASFIYGSDAVAGVIDVKPALPPIPNTIGGSVDLIGKSNNNLYGTSANVYGRKRHWFFDSRVTYQNYGDYRVPAEEVSVYSYRVKLKDNYLRNTAGSETGLHLNTGYLGSKFRSVFYLSNIYSRSGFFANAHGLEPRRVDTALHDASNRDIQMPSQEVNHFKAINRSQYQLGNHQLQADVGYQHNFRQEFNRYVNHGYMPPVYPDTMRIPSNLEREYNKHVYSLNLRDKWQLNNHELTFGLNGEHQENAISGWSFLVPGFKQSTAGAFAYDKYRLNEHLLLHGALRYDYGHQRVFKYIDWFPTNGEYLARAEGRTRNYTSFVWSAGVNYTPGGHFGLKANVGKSFRMPIVKEVGANGVNYHYFSYELGNATLNPEQSYQADVTIGWTHERWSVQLSPFYNYFSNYIYLNPTARVDVDRGAGNQVFEYRQSQVSRYGGELQVRYQVASTLSAEVLGEYLYSKQLSGDKEGFTLPFSPPPSVLLNLTYQPVLKKNTYISVDYRITGAQNNIVPPEKKTPGYQLWNLQAGTKIKVDNQQLALSFQIQNVINTRYLNHTSFYRLIELPEMGRNIVLSIKVHFTNK